MAWGIFDHFRPCLLFFHWFRNPGEAEHRLLWRRRQRMDPFWGGAVHLSAEVAQNHGTYASGCPQLELELVVCSSCSNAGTARPKLCSQPACLHWTAHAQQWASVHWIFISVWPMRTHEQSWKYTFVYSGSNLSIAQAPFGTTCWKSLVLLGMQGSSVGWLKSMFTLD